MTGGQSEEVAKTSQDMTYSRLTSMLPEDKGNAAPATRARFEYQDECVVSLILDHLGGDLEGVLVEHSMDIVLVPKHDKPELISIKHREPHHASDAGWTWSSLGKDSVLADLYSAWEHANRRASVAFVSNAGLSGPAKILWEACRGSETAKEQAAVRLSKSLKIEKADARDFIDDLNIPQHPLPRRNEITAVGVRKMQAHLVDSGRKPWYAEACYLAVMARVARAGIDLPESRTVRSHHLGATVKACVQAEDLRKFNARYISADEVCALISEEYSKKQSEATPLIVGAGTIEIRPLSTYNPVADLGVHLPTRRADWKDLPQYVSRSVDAELDEALSQGGFVVIEGNSAAGKSRSGYEGLKRNAEDFGWKTVVVPSSGQALRDLLTSGHDFSNSAIWLDDLEQFMGKGGVDAGMIRSLCANRSVVILATMRSQAKAALYTAARSDLTARKTLALATVLRVERNLDRDERTQATLLREDPRIADALDRAGEAGFAEYIAAGPSAVERWLSGRHGGNEVGAALVSAAVDFRRAGYLAPVPGEWLRAAYGNYVDPRLRRRVSAGDVDAAFVWATEEVEGASSCLEPYGDKDRYRVFDYLVDYAQQQSTSRQQDPAESKFFSEVSDVPDSIWHELQNRISLDDPQYMSCVSVASVSSHPGLAYEFQRRKNAGRIKKHYFESPNRLLNFAQSCMSVRVCIACQCQIMGVSLLRLIRTMIESVKNFNASATGIPNSSQIVSLDALESLIEDGVEGHFKEALDKCPVADLEAVEEAFSSEGRRESAEFWNVYLSDRRGGSNGQLFLFDK
ncbi:dsDNA nuclease domain-containing protein [Streptomyces sp. NPDC015184]|uniref:dsDNA nuclease domain-containing protein n=1 Tax=Streptomyces sp. NPDC015184 TaxID=3364946 RepID=UPI0036F7F195